jgi:hypothetical protein
MRKATLKPMRIRTLVKAHGQTGQALIFAAIGMFAFVACAGLAVDMGYLRYQRRLQQSAADSAAVAGASAAGSGASVQGDAQADAKLNGFEDGVTLPGAAHPINVVVTGPFTFQGKPNAVTVTVTADHPNFFMRIFGSSLQSTSFTTTATAQYLQASNCMFALSGGGGITINSNVNIPNCGVVDAQNLSGTGSLTAAAIGVHGGSNLTTTNPAVVTGILQTPDPFANMTAPNPGVAHPLLTIDNNNYPPRPPRHHGGQPIPQNVSVPPGSYPGISIAANFLGKVIFQGGNYTIGANGLSFAGHTAVTGNGVMFYLDGGSVTFNNSQKINLSAQTNTAYAGMLFFQKKSNTATATINGSNGSNLQGALYFPGATLKIDGAGTGAQYMIMVAKTIQINNNVSFNSDYHTLANGSPIKASTLVQ